jgi:hypothetical protein
LFLLCSIGIGHKREEVLGGCRRLHNEELHNLLVSSNIIRVIKSRMMIWSGHVARMGETRNSCSILVGKLEGRKPLGRPRRRWEDNNLIEFREVVWVGVDRIHLA